MSPKPEVPPETLGLVHPHAAGLDIGAGEFVSSFRPMTAPAYSGFAVGGFQWPILTMALPIGFLFLSHYLWHKKMGTL